MIQDLDNGFKNTTIGSCTSQECSVNTTLIYLCDNHPASFSPECALLGSAVVTCTDEHTWYPSLGTCTPGE